MLTGQHPGESPENRVAAEPARLGSITLLSSAGVHALKLLRRYGRLGTTAWNNGETFRSAPLSDEYSIDNQLKTTSFSSW
jgi:hypothetical protein